MTCICTCMQQTRLLLQPLSGLEAPVALHSSTSASQLFPKAVCQWCVMPRVLLEGNNVAGRGGGEVCVGRLGHPVDALARDRSCSPVSHIKLAYNVSEGMWCSQVPCTFSTVGEVFTFWGVKRGLKEMTGTWVIIVKVET